LIWRSVIVKDMVSAEGDFYGMVMSKIEKTEVDSGSEQIGARIRRLRELRGWSQGQLAQRAGLYQPALCVYETGVKDAWGMELATAWRLAWALGTSIDTLAGIPELRG